MKPEHREALDAALASGNYMVCYTQCWACQLGEHLDPPAPHPWWDDEDVEHARATGQKLPDGNCGCYCARGAGSES